MNKVTPVQMFAIRLYAILLIVVGVGAVVEIASGFFNDSWYLNFIGFLGIFIGKGLLDHREIWRKWAVFVAWLGILSLLAVFALAFLTGMEPQWTIAGFQVYPSPSVYFVGLLWAALFLFLLWQQWILTRPSVIESFSARGEKSNWWLPIAAASLVVCGLYAMQDTMTNRLLHSIRHYAVRVEAFDASTGDRLTPWIHLSTSGTNQVFSGPTIKGLKGAQEVSAIGNRPIKIGVSAEGYREKTITITTSNSDKTIRVELERE